MVYSLLATDLDGTLLNRAAQISEGNISALQRCGEQGIVRVAATGRSYYSSLRVLADNAPIDYLVFSCGAGVLRWSDRQLLYSRTFSQDAAAKIGRLLQQEELAFMAHAPIPFNHFFWYDDAGQASNKDLLARIAHYEECVLGRVNASSFAGGLTQFLVTTECLEEEFASLSLLFAPFAETVRSTSPFLPSHKWLELFPKGVNKGSSLLWLCHELGIGTGDVAVVGNDYNDLPMLERFPTAYVVGNAPSQLKERFRVVATNDADGVAEVVTNLMHHSPRN